jgi:hypothetical protein
MTKLAGFKLLLTGLAAACAAVVGFNVVIGVFGLGAAISGLLLFIALSIFIWRTTDRPGAKP